MMKITKQNYFIQYQYAIYSDKWGIANTLLATS